MQFKHSALLRCPIDQAPLQQHDKQLRCDNGHTFDIARQGYVNLLGAADKRSRDPGDGKAMVAARQAFLHSGHYQVLAQHLTDLVAPLVGADSVILDAGCGDGYYLQQLQSELEARGMGTPAMIGFDISKWAVQAATKHVNATWLVASNRNIPLAPCSVDCLLSLFGFPVFDAFYAALKPGGTALIATAGPQHLIELREVLYPSIKSKESTWQQHAKDSGFTIAEAPTLQFTTAPLKQQDINHLLNMTPHLFRASHEGKTRAAALDNFAVTVDVIFQHLQKPLEN